MCCGEGGTLQTNIADVYGECSQCMDRTGFAPAHSGMCFLGLHCSGSRVFCRAMSKKALRFMHFPGLSHTGSGSRVLLKGTDSVGRAFCALPRSEQLRRPGAWRAHCPRWAVCLNHLLGPSPSASWVHHESTVTGAPYVSFGELISGCDPPGRCQPYRIPGRPG